MSKSGKKKRTRSKRQPKKAHQQRNSSTSKPRKVWSRCRFCGKSFAIDKSSNTHGTNKKLKLCSECSNRLEKHAKETYKREQQNSPSNQKTKKPDIPRSLFRRHEKLVRCPQCNSRVRHDRLEKHLEKIHGQQALSSKAKAKKTHKQQVPSKKSSRHVQTANKSNNDFYSNEQASANNRIRNRKGAIKGGSIQETLALFGHNKFNPGQEKAINSILAGHDLLVVLPTGSGKSLIYQVAAYHLPGTILVISPLIALMKDQVDKLTSLEIPAIFINSSLSSQEQEQRLTRMANGEYKLVYVAPERLRQYSFLETIKNIKIGLLTVDEAHCISQWGHDFRPDYLHIADFRQSIGNPNVVALTATATPKVKKEIKQLLHIPSAKEVTTGFDRPNIRLEVVSAQSAYKQRQQKLAILAKILEGWDETKGSIICYVGRRRDAAFVAWFFQKGLSLHAGYYHAGLESSQREAIQDDFITGKLPIVVATNAFGMGIDRSDVRMVIHHTMPGSLEAYYQEVGRAGRDGKPAKAILLYNERDRELQEYFIESSTLSYDDLARLHNALREHVGIEGWINPDQLTRELQFDKEGVKVRVGLQRLEEGGMVEQGTYEGLERLVCVHDWSDQEAREIVEQLQKYRKQREEQLEKMVAYASNENKCRRQMLLEHFGEKIKENKLDSCCDVCARSGGHGRLQC